MSAISTEKVANTSKLCYSFVMDNHNKLTTRIDIMDLTALSKDDKRTLFIQMLQEGEVTVTFTKVNGETRAMPCTLAPSLIPVETTFVPTISEATEKKERKVSTEVIRVFCTDKQEWRSFRIDSVTNITK